MIHSSTDKNTRKRNVPNVLELVRVLRTAALERQHYLPFRHFPFLTKKLTLKKNGNKNCQFEDVCAEYIRHAPKQTELNVHNFAKKLLF